jgi:hypothetical protein
MNEKILVIPLLALIGLMVGGVGQHTAFATNEDDYKIGFGD